MPQRDVRHIIRQWDREIQEQHRREAEREANRGPWRIVSWLALWFLWLGVLLLIMQFFRALHW